MNAVKRNVLILFAHPSVHQSTINVQLLKALRSHPTIVVNDLYEQYPEFYIDVKREQRLLHAADLVVFQHPLYWYSSPAILKLWQDVVLEKGFAFGPGGSALQGKYLLSAISTAGKQGSYSSEGRNLYPINDLLKPFAATANLCGMIYLPPIVMHNAADQTQETIEKHCKAYIDLLDQYIEQGESVFDTRAEYTLLTE